MLGGFCIAAAAVIIAAAAAYRIEFLLTEGKKLKDREEKAIKHVRGAEVLKEVKR